MHHLKIIVLESLSHVKKADKYFDLIYKYHSISVIIDVKMNKYYPSIF